VTVLLDTNVLSELVKPRPDAAVMAFVAAQSDPVLSVISLHELTYGAERAPDAARRARLLVWIASVRSRFAGRLVNIDADIAEQGGRLRALAAANGHAVEALDALIAASALARAASVATRNVRDFAPLGIETVNPWKA
jgi:predicted nucleic acid-binding protein